MLVLSPLDKRSFKAVAGPWSWNVEFIVYKRGGDQPVARSRNTCLWIYNASLETNLEAGDYVVHVRARDPRYVSETDRPGSTTRKVVNW